MSAANDAVFSSTKGISGIDRSFQAHASVTETVALNHLQPVEKKCVLSPCATVTLSDDMRKTSFDFSSKLNKLLEVPFLPSAMVRAKSREYQAVKTTQQPSFSSQHPFSEQYWAHSEAGDRLNKKIEALMDACLTEFGAHMAPEKKAQFEKGGQFRAYLNKQASNDSFLLLTKELS